jgi:hypothetical protein
VNPLPYPESGTLDTKTEIEKLLAHPVHTDVIELYMASEMTVPGVALGRREVERGTPL